MVRELELDWIVPQHGRPFRGREVIDELLSWLTELECGIDLMTQEHYRLPKRRRDWV
jgi:flavorubredoxin